MDTLTRLQGILSPECVHQMALLGDGLYEIRLRAGQPVQLRHQGGSQFCGEPVTLRAMERVMAALMEYSVYAREEELKSGFFAMADGCRVGVCGRMVVSGGEVQGLGSVGSLCIRMGREIRGSGDGLMPWAIREGRVNSLLIISAPGMGKTTCLRDLARQISRLGYCVGIGDERHEIAACARGVPTLDVGPCTDVMDGVPKWISVGHMVRAMSPQVIITDEIGGARDGEALADAARCGVAIIASAHGESFEALESRVCMRSILQAGVFRNVALLDGRPGCIREVREYAGWREGRPLWKCG